MGEPAVLVRKLKSGQSGREFWVRKVVQIGLTLVFYIPRAKCSHSSGFF